MRIFGFYVAVLSFVLGVAYASLLSFSWPVLAFLSLLSVLFVAGFFFTKQFVYLIALLGACAVCAGGVRTVIAPTALPPAFVPLVEERVELEGTIVIQPDVRETNTRLTIEVEKEGEQTRVVASAPTHKKFMVGDKVSVSGKLSLPEPFATDGGRSFAYDKFLAKDGVFAVISPAHVEVTGRSPSLVLGIFRVLQLGRDAFMKAVARTMPEPESALAVGLIVGGKQGLGEELLNVFTVAGLIHIVVLSGYNVTIVAEAVLRCLGFLPRKVAFATACATIGLFVLAAGAGAAATRAGAMALLGLIARSTGRTYEVVTALFLTLFGMLLWNPLLLMHDPGFQFSFVATLGLIVLCPHVEKVFRWVKLTFVREITASTFAAQIGVLPILLFQTGNLSLVSFIVNIIVLPVIPLAMGCAALASFVALILPAFADAFVTAVGLPAYALLSYVIFAARTAASFPLASVVIPAFPFWSVVLTYGGLGLLVLKLEKRI